jgi:hypothetical protein
VSRASAISFLKKMAEEGFLEHREVTISGGVYSGYPIPTEG